MKKSIRTALFLFQFCLGSALVSFGQAFPCDNGQRLYFFQNTGGTNGSLACITGYTSGTPVVTALFPMPTQHHNGLAGNPVDNYLYYLDFDQLTRLSSTGTATPVCQLASSSLYGCFDNKGRYWTVQGGDLQAYDINTCTVVKGPYTLPISNGFLDVAFNPKDCHFYIGDLRVDTNGVADPGYPGTLFVPTGTYGGVAIGEDGNIYGLAGTGAVGDLSVIDLSSFASNSVSSITPGPTAAKSDMASFPCAYVNAQFSDSLTACTSAQVFFADHSTGPIGNWLWDFGDPASGSANTTTVQSPSHIFSSPGTYTVTLLVSTGNNMCYSTAWDTALAVITVSPSSGLSLSFSQSNIACSDSCTGMASVSANTGNMPFSYAWSTGHTTSALNALCAGTYSVTVSDASGCTQNGTVTITSSGGGPAVSVSGNTSICKNDSTVLTASGGTVFLWSTGATTSSVEIAPGQPTTYSVTVWLNGCSSITSVPVLVNTASLDLGADVDLCGMDEVKLVAGDVAASYEWSTGENTPEITVTTPGTYWLTVFNGNCQASDTVDVKGDALGGSALYVPNCFTPGNNGINDIFAPKGTDITDFHMMIFNRWGELIFETNDLSTGWDGKCRNTFVQQDVYIYKISYRTACSSLRTREKTGHVSVLK